MSKHSEALKKRLAFLEDKCDTYIERDIGMCRAIAAIMKEQRKRFKDYVNWQKEIQAIRAELEQEEQQ